MEGIAGVDSWTNIAAAFANLPLGAYSVNEGKAENEQ